LLEKLETDNVNPKILDKVYDVLGNDMSPTIGNLNKIRRVIGENINWKTNNTYQKLLKKEWIDLKNIVRDATKKIKGAAEFLDHADEIAREVYPWVHHIRKITRGVGVQAKTRTARNIYSKGADEGIQEGLEQFSKYSSKVRQSLKNFKKYSGRKASKLFLKKTLLGYPTLGAGMGYLAYKASKMLGGE
jgi:hypothetical protein